MSDNLLILLSRRDGKHFYSAVWDVKKEPFSLLHSQVNMYDFTQQKFQMQHCQAYRPQGTHALAELDTESVGQGPSSEKRMRPSSSHGVLLAVHLPFSAWLCHFSMFSRCLLSTFYVLSSAWTPVKKNNLSCILYLKDERLPFMSSRKSFVFRINLNFRSGNICSISIFRMYGTQ